MKGSTDERGLKKTGSAAIQRKASAQSVTESTPAVNDAMQHCSETDNGYPSPTIRALPVTEHTLKIWPEFYAETVTGRKTAQLRKNDRRFKIGDVLILQEFDPRRRCYCGHETQVEVTDLIEKCEGLAPGYCILSIKLKAGAISKWNSKLAGKKERKR